MATKKKLDSQSQLLSDLKIDENNITIEEFLMLQCEEIIKKVKEDASRSITNLRKQYSEGEKQINDLMKSTISGPKNICVVLKCIAGLHIGQRFRLETATGDDEFKVGRSTGKQFKEKGVSLYKDKEISTTHAKIEIRNGIAFLIDLRSTNGTQLNTEDVEALVPYRLQNGDVITMGSTELRVQIASDDCENVNNNIQL